MPSDRPMYRWRRMTPEQRNAAMVHRKLNQLPWHGPPHYTGESNVYMVTAACYEHEPVLTANDTRLAEFEADLLDSLKPHSEQIFAWTILPNHYHFLAHVPDIKVLLAAIGQLHGRTSYRWNGEDNCRGRKVWYRAAETAIKSERHLWAAFNFVLHNAVRHGYVERWQDWPFSNATAYLAAVGREEAERRWREYPLFDFGKDWDPPEL